MGAPAFIVGCILAWPIVKELLMIECVCESGEKANCLIWAEKWEHGGIYVDLKQLGPNQYNIQDFVLVFVLDVGFICFALYNS